jgi:hypothetical protein
MTNLLVGLFIKRCGKDLFRSNFQAYFPSSQTPYFSEPIKCPTLPRKMKFVNYIKEFIENIFIGRYWLNEYVYDYSVVCLEDVIYRRTATRALCIIKHMDRSRCL